MINDVWKRYQGDFNAMSDKDIDDEVRRMEDQIDEAESWLEAVASWRAAGCPRTPEKAA